MTINEKKYALHRINMVQAEINRCERMMNKLTSDPAYLEKRKAAEIRNYGHPLSDDERIDRIERKEFEKIRYRSGMVDLMALLGFPVELHINDAGDGEWDFTHRQY